ncbi:MAG: TetR/AcrR family transcriptional regulator [Myxococcota bacterium]
MPRPRADDYDEKRQAILDRAATLFAEHGFARTRMGAIAEACGVSKAGIYHYYASKEALLEDMLVEHVERLQEAGAAAVAAAHGPEAKLRSLLRAMMAIYARSGAKHVVLLADLDVLPSERREAIVQGQREVVALFAALVSELAPGAPRAPATMALLGTINFTFAWFDPDGPLGPEAYADLVADLFLRGAVGD